jgi:hypothetical protein
MGSLAGKVSCSASSSKSSWWLCFASLSIGISTLQSEKSSNQFGDLVSRGIHGEMAGIQNVNFGAGHVSTIGFRF